MKLMFLLLIWAILMGMLAIYVIYRILTDRDRGGSSHALYPLFSRPTDPTFPDRGNILGWVAYSLLLLGICGFVVGLYLEVSGRGGSQPLNAATGVALVGGIALMALARFRNRRTR